MPKENDQEGAQDMGGKHGGQAGMPKPEQQSAAQKAIAKDEKGRERSASEPASRRER